MKLIGIFFAGAALVFAQAPSCSLLPGWSQKGPARSYTADNLFEYMDGNAEGYLIYGFAKMQGVTCVSGDRAVLIDISEMADPDGAYGIFSANRDPNRPDVQLGMGGQVLPRRATFAKGSYYVEVASNTESDMPDVLQAFAAELAKQISGQTTLPDALSWFPKEKLVSVRLIPESVLGLRVLKRGYVAQYESGKAFLVAEASPESAAQVIGKLRARYADAAPAQVGDEAIQAQDKYLLGLCFFRKGRYIGGYANLPDAAAAVASSAGLAAKLP